jgi:hypothetical protein
MILIYTMQAMLGYGDDDCIRPFQYVALEAFESLLSLSSLNEITKIRQSKAIYNYPYIEESASFPCQYHLEILSEVDISNNMHKLGVPFFAFGYPAEIYGKKGDFLGT